MSTVSTWFLFDEYPPQALLISVPSTIIIHNYHSYGDTDRTRIKVDVPLQYFNQYFSCLFPCLPLSILQIHMAAVRCPSSCMARSLPDTLLGVLDRLLSVRGRGAPLNGGWMVFAALMGSERGK